MFALRAPMLQELLHRLEYLFGPTAAVFGIASIGAISCTSLGHVLLMVGVLKDTITFFALELDLIEQALHI